jgi:hypothetical protein
VNRDFQQEEVQPCMHVHIVYIKSIEFKFTLLFNIIDCNLDLMFYKKHKYICLITSMKSVKPKLKKKLNHLQLCT